MEEIQFKLTHIAQYVTLDKPITKYTTKDFEGWVTPDALKNIDAETEEWLMWGDEEENEDEMEY